MPYVNPFTAVVNGDPMDATQVTTALDSARDYVNDGVVAATDIADHSLETSDFYKPETFGFPLTGTIGTTQQLYSAQRGNGERLSPVHFQGPFIIPWCYAWMGMPSPTRVTILPRLLQPTEKMVVPHMARRLYVRNQGFVTQVQLFASWHFIVLGEMEQSVVINENDLSVPVADYPGEGGGSTFGSFVLAYRKAGDADWSLLEVTRRQIYPQEKQIDYQGSQTWAGGTGSQPLNEFDTWSNGAVGVGLGKAVSYMAVCHFECTDAVGFDSEGWYDFALLYDKTSAGVNSNAGLQIVMGVRNLLIEIFPN